MHKKNNRVFNSALVISLILVFLGILAPSSLQEITANIKNNITSNFGWLYLLLVTIILVFCIFMILSPIGQIRLGDPHAKPEYTTMSWIAMMFSAGMGIGLVFYGAAEPLSHYAISAVHDNPETQEALADSFRYTFFHWGLHAWAIYALVALALAYFGFRKKEKYVLSVTLKPLLGNKTEGAIGTVVDTITVIATVIGVATTLGFGAAQINGGLAYIFNIPNNATIQIIIMIIATVIFILSSVSGVDKGIKILSDLNLVVAILLLAITIILGPTVKIFDNMTTSLGNYFQNLPSMSLSTSAFNEMKRSWADNWTIFYWAWWISWSPFVGIFIARISKGRSIREFLTVVLLIPTILSIIWFSAFGTLSTSVQRSGINLTNYTTEEILFATFDNLPLGPILSVIAIFLVLTFFITSVNSATYVLAMLTDDGNLSPSNMKKVFWGIILVLIAIVLLLSGGLTALQNILIIVALPFSVILVFILVALFKELYHEKREMGLSITPERYPTKDEPFKSYED